jgi:UDP-GlcNAc:undecaprenyl-phosphate/decaprenyl-phosphate GlcNAc-1-phosphate transferase
MSTLFPFIGSAFVFLVIAITWIEICKKRKILDRPGPDVPARNRVPNMQWVFLILWFFITSALFFPSYYENKAFLGLVVGWWFIMIFSLIDTALEASGRKWIKAKYRLVLQVIAWLIALWVWWVSISELVVNNNVTLSLPYVAVVWLTLVWFVWFMNAINWFDWINWLASWISTIWFVTVYFLLQNVVLPYYADIISPEHLATLVMTTNVAFLLTLWWLLYTTIEYKPTGLLRDIWIIFYWYALAYLSLMGWAKIGTLLVVLSLPIFDAIWVFVNRIFIMKKSPMKKDYTHLHYRLMALWRTRSEVRRFVRWWSIFFMIIMLLQDTNRMSKIIIFILMAVIFFGVNVYLFWVKKMPMEYKVIKNS